MPLAFEGAKCCRHRGTPTEADLEDALARAHLQSAGDALIAPSVEEIEDSRHGARRPASRVCEELGGLLTDTSEWAAHHHNRLPSWNLACSRATLPREPSLFGR